MARMVAATASAAAFAAVVTGFAAHEATAKQRNASASNASTSPASSPSTSSGSSAAQRTFADDDARFGDDSSIYTGRQPSSSFGSATTPAVAGRGFLSPSAGTSSHGS